MGIVELLNEIWRRLLPPVHHVEHPDRDEAGGIELIATHKDFLLSAFDMRGPRRMHEIQDVDGLISYLGRHGRSDSTTVFCGDKRIVVVLDDIDRPDIDKVKMPVIPSVEIEAWERFVGVAMKHIKFHDMIENLADDLCEKEILAQITQFRRTTSMEYDSKADPDGGMSYVFRLKEGEKASGLVKLPRRFEIDVPVFDGWPKRYRIALRLIVETGNDQPVFVCEFVDLRTACRQALVDIAQYISDSLEGEWLVIRGSGDASLPLLRCCSIDK